MSGLLIEMQPGGRRAAATNNGREWRPRVDPEPVRVHAFVDPELGKANPCGVYDIGTNTGWVSV